MTDDEVLETFPGVTQEDLDDLRSGEVVVGTMTDHEGTLCKLWYDPESDQFSATDNWR